LLIAVNVCGLPYYVMPMTERVRSPLHPWLKPSGYVGQAAGVVAFLALAFLWLYPVRKRYPSLAWTGSLARWLDVHIVVGLAVPLLAVIHASWRFDGLIGLGFWALMVVWLSGLIGRYLYLRIPRSKSGLELTIEEINASRSALLEQIASDTTLDVGTVKRILERGTKSSARWGPLATIARFGSDDVNRWRACRALRASCGAGRSIDRRALGRALRLARREMALTQQVRMLDATQRIFRYWHIAHRPFALTALAAVVIHVVVVVTLGVTWFW
jgi:hypothetical protein